MFDQLEEINRTVTDAVRSEMTEVTAEDLGLDRRAGYRFWVSEDAIAVSKDSDRSLQYYGGFEYVDSEFRTQYGDWVFYFAEDSRVAEHLSKYYDQLPA